MDSGLTLQQSNLRVVQITLIPEPAQPWLVLDSVSTPMSAFLKRFSDRIGIVRKVIASGSVILVTRVTNVSKGSVVWPSALEEVRGDGV